MGMRFQVTEEQVLKACQDEMNKVSPGQELEESSKTKLEAHFELAGIKQWKVKNITGYLLSAEPCPIGEWSCLRFCQNQATMSKSHKSTDDEALKQIYLLAKKNDWGPVMNVFTSNQKLIPKDLPQQSALNPTSESTEPTTRRRR